MFPSLHVFYFGVFWVDSILNMILCFGQKLKALKRDVPAECLHGGSSLGSQTRNRHVFFVRDVSLV